MTIAEAQRALDRLRDDIFELVRAFEEETGTTVHGIDLGRIDQCDMEGDRKSILTSVSIEARIEPTF